MTIILLYILCFTLSSIVLGTRLRKTIEATLSDLEPEMVKVKEHNFGVLKDGTLEIFGGACALGDTIYIEESMIAEEYVLDHEMSHLDLKHGYLKPIFFKTSMVSKVLVPTVLLYGFIVGGLVPAFILAGVGLLLSEYLKYYSNLHFELAADNKMQPEYKKQLLKFLKTCDESPIIKRRIAALKTA